MDMTRNKIPQDVKTIHLIAVCGTGMGALACMLKEMGYTITGSDQAVYPPMSDFLISKGIELFEGYRETNLSYHPDLVIVGNAIKKDNPEVLYTEEKGIPFLSMPQALKGFAGSGKESIVIAGTHGKTTTSSLMAWVLYDAGLDPSFMIGGIVNNFRSNYRLGNGRYIVFEGDEYDTAFFDKGPKFLHYDPHLAILTSVEFDHADIFSDMNAVLKAFDRFVSAMSEDRKLIACGDYQQILSLVSDRRCQVETYGRHPDAMWQLGKTGTEGGFQIFEVLRDGELFGTFKINMMGEHNLMNAISVIAVSESIGISSEKISHALMTFTGIKRRQEVRGVRNGITVMDDFAHHPTAVKETLRGVRPFYPHGRIIAVFEPRTNSSKRKVFQAIYPDSFSDADIVCISEPENIEKIPENDRFSSVDLVRELKKKGKQATCFKDADSIVQYIIEEAKPGDLVLIMSSGGFGGIHQKLLDRL
ncbi:MAG: UDP-N-acetylmuramate:L-alanyl-gamma-D-glutamyl-meso-diaminopimelate ligase [Proteobacteria bacterium]|nr:UDP-N-acetylmuramate:L-alanyl-gamma-D-glutamyl-meso-diaminopimelate ligase [Pseudomonadota bacterium]